MARQQVKRARQGLTRIVFAEGLDIFSSLVSVFVTHQKADDHVAEGVIHGRVELGALQIATQMAVADLVGGIFPDFAEQQCVRLFGKYCLLNLGQEVIGKLVGHIQAPAMSAGT